MTVQHAHGEVEPIVGPGQASKLMLIYGLGFVAVYVVFTLLFRHAWNKRDELQLSPIERHDTVTSILGHVATALVGVFSISLVLVGGDWMAGWAGVSYVLLGPVHTVLGIVRGRRRQSLELAAAAGTPA